MDDQRKQATGKQATGKPANPSQEEIDANSLLAGGQSIPGPGQAHAREGHVPTHGAHSVLDELGLLPKGAKR